MPDQSDVLDTSRPWLGLKPFGPSTQRLFFGRSREIRELFQRVKDHPLTVLYGKSGLGKTSLLGAGLVPRLLIEGYRPTLVRLRFGVTDPRLKDQVHAALGGTLADGRANADDAGLSSNDITLWERMHHIPTRPSNLATAPPVLIFDQFEEVFTLADAEQLSSSRRQEVLDLLDELADLVENRPPTAVRSRLLEQRELAEDFDFNASPLRIVIALREDYLASLESSSSIMPSLMRNRQMLHELDGASALEAVVAPGRRNDMEIVSDDVGRSIVCFVSRRSFDTPLAEIKAVPPILSLMCFELNEARLSAGSTSITAEQVEGESEEILHSFYERTFANLAAPVRHLVEDRLLTRSGHRNSVAREDALAELESAGVPNGVDALDRLIAGRILTSEEVGGIQRLELTHDVLAPLALRSRNERHERERAERAEHEQEESRKRAVHAQRERNRLRIVVAAMTVLVMIASASTVLSWRKTREAQVAAAQLTFLEAERGLGGLQTFWTGVRDLSRSLGMGLPSVDARVGYRIAQVVERRPASVGGAPAATSLRDGPAELTWSAGAAVARPMAHKGEIRRAVFSPDGRSVVTASADGTARVWESATGRPLSPPMKHDAQVTSAAFSPDGREIVTASADNTARIWDAATAQPLAKPIVHDEDVNAVAFSPDGQWVATASWDRTARVWNAKTAEPVSAPMVHEAAVNDVAFSPNGTQVVTASGDGTARVWDAKTGEAVAAPMVHADAVVHAEFSSDGRWVVTASADNTARVWEAATAKPVSPPLSHDEAVNYAAFSPDGRWVVTASDDNTAQVWESATGKQVARFVHDLDVVRATFDRSGMRVVTASSDNTARIWQTTTGALTAPKIMHADGVVDAEFSPNGNWVVTASMDRTARVWETTAGATVAAPIYHGGDVRFGAFSADGQQIVTASWDGTARVWESATGRPLSPPMKHDAQVTSAAFSPDGREIVTASADNTARIWDAATAQPLAKPIVHDEDVNAVAFSPDGQWVATASWDRTARVWNAKTAEPVSAPMVHEAAVNDVAFSPNGTQVVTASGDGTARVWDAKTGEAVAAPMVHADAVVHAEFSSDGRWVVTASADNTARVWEAATAKPVSPPLSHDEAVNYAAFSPDGRWVVTASDDNTAQVWESATGKQVLASFQHKDNVIHAVFSPDGRWVATASWDHTARVWDTESGRPQTDPVLHEDSVLHVAFSPDGRRLLTSSADDSARVVPLSNYEQADPETLADVLALLVVCGGEATSASGVCRAATGFGQKVDELTKKVKSPDARDRLRYHLLGDAAAHPLLASTPYAGKPELLRDALFPNVELLEHWWRSTAYPELEAAWALALAQRDGRENRRTLAEIVKGVGGNVRAGKAAQDIDLAELQPAASGTLRFGAQHRQLLDDDSPLETWSAPPLRVANSEPEVGVGAQSETNDDSLAATRAMVELARTRELGVNAERDIANALGLFRQAAERGNAAAAFEYALRIERGVGSVPDHDSAMHWYATAATLGNSQAAYRLGQVYDEGIGEARNTGYAAHWYRLAAMSGHAAAHYALARVLLEDEKLQPDDRGVARAALIRLIDAYPRSEPASDMAWLSGEAWLLAREYDLLSPDAKLADRRDNTEHEQLRNTSRPTP